MKRTWNKSARHVGLRKRKEMSVELERMDESTGAKAAKIKRQKEVGIKGKYFKGDTELQKRHDISGAPYG